MSNGRAPIRFEPPSPETSIKDVSVLSPSRGEPEPAPARIKQGVRMGVKYIFGTNLAHFE